MALTNTKRSILLLKDGAVLPTNANAIEVTEEFVVNANAEVTEFERISGNLGSYDSYIDPNKAMMSGESYSTMMRTSDKGGTALDTPPVYGEVLKVCGMKEVIDTTTPGQETVTYLNTQAPTTGSIVAYVDDKKWTSTNSIVGDASMTFTAGSSAQLDFSLSGYFDNEGIPVDESNPTVTLTQENVLVVTKNDVITAGGIGVQADEIRLNMNAEIEDFYGVNGLKEFNIVNYNIKIEADFYIDKANYKNEQEKVINQTIEALEIILGADETNSEVSGKSVKITANLAKASSVTDTVDKSKAKRTMVWLIQNNSAGEAFEMVHGFFQP